jgi:opacity protein-like surface antigen
MNRVAKRSFKLRAINCALTGIALLGICGFANAQAVATATRSVGFDAFGGVSYMKLDLGSTYKQFRPGFVVGGDLTHLIHGFGVSIEPRFGRTTSSYDDQTYFLGDLKIDKAFGRFHPYGFAGIGYGKVAYVIGAGHDDSIVYTVGPGLDYDVTRSWAVKADWQYQFWNVGHETHGFNPTGITVAAVYRFHFGR